MDDNNITRGGFSLKRLALAMACIAGVAGCGQEPPEAPSLVRPVKILEVGTDGAGRIQEFPGFVRAVKSAEVGFEVPGRIIALEAKEGQEVAKGDVLGQLDDLDYRAELDVALANLRKAEADLGRSENVFAEDPGAITPQRIDGDRRAVEIAEARLTQARKALREAVLVSPFNGVVSRRLVEVFENVQAKQPVVIIENLREMEVQVNVPERDVVGHPGEPRPDMEDLDSLNRQARPVVRISALPELEFPGRIHEIATRADSATRTFAVRIGFEAPETTVILPGMTARVLASFRSRSGLHIPVEAVVATPDSRTSVWVVDPGTMTVTRREVEVGEMSGGTVAVLSGLEPGEWIATSGTLGLAEGMEVRRFERAF
jgi:RND family efflux transporter MFP subunit